MKEQIDKLDFHFAIDTLKRIKNQAIDWEKNFAKHISKKGLVTIIDKEFSKLNKNPT